MVLRLSYVSKLHAHIVTDTQPFRIVAQQSVNGTSLNGEALVPDREYPLRVEDRVKLGAIELALLDASSLYDFLLREVLAS